MTAVRLLLPVVSIALVMRATDRILRRYWFR